MQNLRAALFTGSFTDRTGNPQYSGTLSGSAIGGTLSYTFKQPATGATGRGLFKLKWNGARWYMWGEFVMSGGDGWVADDHLNGCK